MKVFLRVAAKNKKLGVVNVLKGRLLRAPEETLNWKYQDGDTVLHFTTHKRLITKL